jgi:hypothetical protein
MTSAEARTSPQRFWRLALRFATVLRAGAGVVLFLAGTSLTVWTVVLGFTEWYPGDGEQQLSAPELASSLDDFRSRCYVATAAGGVVMILGSGLCLGWRGLVVAAAAIVPMTAAIMLAFGRVTVGQ